MDTISHGDRGKFDAVLIAGPTASGKSAIAIAAAKALDAVVVNADSMQVYADLHVLTARPDAAEMDGAPHLLFGHVDGAVNYSVGHWLADVERVLRQMRREGRLVILVGGTGLYFKALTQGLSDMPKVPEAVRQQVRAESAGLEAPALHRRLQDLDPLAAAQLRPSDPQRILRALEMVIATGRSLVEWQRDGRASPLLAAGRWRGLFLNPERAKLVAAIDRRFDAMLERGALDEVRALAARQLDPALPVMRAHGVPGLIDYLHGASTLDEARSRGQRDTRHYSKRQMTWFRHQLAGFDPVAPDEGLARITDRRFWA